MKPCLFIFFALLLTSCQDKNQKNSQEEKIQQPKGILHISHQEFESGDILLKKGYGIVSELVIKTLDDGNPYSHCGLIYKQDTNVYVMHSISKEFSDIDGVQKTPLSTFLQDCQKHTLKIIRLKDTSQKKQRLAQEGLLLCKKNIPFDYSFDYQDSSKMYCSEFLYVILLKTLQVDIFEKKRVNKSDLLTFSCFNDTNLFTFVSNY